MKSRRPNKRFDSSGEGMETEIQFESLTGRAIEAALLSLARLRIEVFYAFPYLYDGDLAYEESYLRILGEARDSLVVVARSGGQLIGCATGSALDGHHDAFAAPLKARSIDPGSCFYCGESVLLPGYRGRGIGHAFFDRREAHARARGYRYSCFCAVIRPEDHPMRPADYSPLDEFWQKRGYRKLDGAIATFGWKDIGDASETDKRMQVWLRELS